MKLDSVKYNEVKDQLKTGDLILFHGMSNSSKLNEILSGSEWSHVGMVILSKDFSSDGCLPFIKRGKLVDGPLIDVSAI